MSPASVAAVLRAHLEREGLVLCRAPDTTFPLDGMRESEALMEIATLASDAIAIPDPEVTMVMPGRTVDHLRALSKRLR